MSKSKPGVLKIGKDRYVAVVLKVTKKDVYGRPELCEVIHDDQTTTIEGAEEFAIVYMVEQLVKKRPPS